MRALPIRHERISFANIAELPEMEVRFSACRFGVEGQYFDIVDFTKKAIDRWFLPTPRIAAAFELLKTNFPAQPLPYLYSNHEALYNEYFMQPHVAHLTATGTLITSFGNKGNGLCVCIVDTHSGQARIFPDDFDKKLMLYSSTCDLAKSGDKWLFARWPFEQTLDVMQGRRWMADCELAQLDLSTNKCDVLYRLTARDRIHQVTCSPDGRYIVLAPFHFELNVPYPSVPIQDDPEGYRRSHEGGMKKGIVVTIDLVRRCHWQTEIPVPVPAHFEFDPIDPHVFYLSAHNFFDRINTPMAGMGPMMLEGPGAILKMRIGDGTTEVAGAYSDDQFFRITQHMPFRLGDKTLIAVTTLPNKLDLLDACNMTLWRRVELFPAPPIDLSKTGNGECPLYPLSCFSVDVSRDGRYLVLESAKAFHVYDVVQDHLLGATVPRSIVPGSRGVGHTRSVGL
ncbi:MAG TPA: hypothetical protein VHD56_03895 [Tepidisphaeraceae bacterium]|nr:hypothetical protein [Tepidisphaeraceae bacterium]